MNTKYNLAAIKLLEAAKLIQTVKDSKLTERNDRILRLLWQSSAELLAEETKVPEKNK